MPIVFTAALTLLMFVGCSSVATSPHAAGSEHRHAAPCDYCDAVPSPEPRATIPAPIMIGDLPVAITLRRSGMQILVDVQIEDHGPYPFLFDTGAKYTAVDPQLSEAFPDLVIEYESPTRTTPDPSGTIVSTDHSMRLPRVRIGDIHMENVIAPVFDHAHPASFADDVVYGVIGFGHFQSVPTRLNLSEDVLEVGVDTSYLDPDRMGVVPLEIAHGMDGMPFVDVSFEGHIVRCLIDTGAKGGFSIPNEVFGQLIGDDEEAVSEGTFWPFSGTPYTARKLNREVDAFIGPYRIATSPVAEFPMDFGLVGRQVLEYFVITFDPEAGLVLFELVDPADCD